MIERTCVICEFWDAKTSHKDKRNHGLCRINPPVHDGGDYREWSWPVTYDEDWCGRWQAREEAKHDPVFASEEQYWRSRGDSEADIAARIAVRGRG